MGQRARDQDFWVTKTGGQKDWGSARTNDMGIKDEGQRWSVRNVGVREAGLGLGSGIQI